MKSALLSLCLSLCLVFGLTGNVRAAPGHLTAPAHLAGGAVIQVAEGPLAGVNEVIHMEPSHLLFLGLGIIAGATFVAPNLAVSELFGVAIGIVGSEFLYQTVYQPAFGSSRWF